MPQDQPRGDSGAVGPHVMDQTIPRRARSRASERDPDGFSAAARLATLHARGSDGRSRRLPAPGCDARQHARLQHGQPACSCGKSTDCCGFSWSPRHSACHADRGVLRLFASPAESGSAGRSTTALPVHAAANGPTDSTRSTSSMARHSPTSSSASPPATSMNFPACADATWQQSHQRSEVQERRIRS